MCQTATLNQEHGARVYGGWSGARQQMCVMKKGIFTLKHARQISQDILHAEHFLCWTQIWLFIKAFPKTSPQDESGALAEQENKSQGFLCWNGWRSGNEQRYNSSRGECSCETHFGRRNGFKPPRRHLGNHKFSTVGQEVKINAG